MKYGNRKIFLNKAKLAQAINLRLNGLSYSSLAILFNCDRTTIAFHCKRHKIEQPKELFAVQRVISAVIPKIPSPTYKIVNGERINLGKSYSEYYPPSKLRPFI